MPVLVDENLGRVVCPVCGTEYDDSASACPKCGAMGIASKKALMKGEGRPVPLVGPGHASPGPGVVPVQPQGPTAGPYFAQTGYPQQGLFPVRPRYQESPQSLWLGIIGFFLAFGGMMLGMMWIILPWLACKVIAIALNVTALVIGWWLVKKGSRMAIGVLVLAIMGMFMTLLLAGIFWMVGI